ncbi:MAG: TldD/PmbA family protein [Thermoleophilaceae bacterium]|nr:TldD/PmbA family protein [Thermoleophilaceae bacterium]
MRELLLDLVDAAARHADYADARHVATRRERLATRNGVLDDVLAEDSDGVGIRVRVGGAWGFAAVRGSGRAECEAALGRALAVARAQPAAAGGPLAPETPAEGAWSSPCERDPFDVPLDRKLATLLETDAAIRAGGGIAVAIAHFEGRRIVTTFASSEGAACVQSVTECGGGIAALAVDGEDSQIRSYPASHGGQVDQAGYEGFMRLRLADHAPRIAEEAAALLKAPACPAGRMTLILAGEQLGLQIHESIGHAVELDRVLGREISYAGGSYAGPDAVGSLRIGSPLVNVTADASTPGALGTFRWDDEGVEAQALPIVRGGVLAGFLSSRESAAEIGLGRSGGCARASGFDRQPLVRMTNVNLDPGDAGSLDDLIAATGEGLLIESNRSWSIDDRRLHFQFGGEAAWEIRGGERGRLLRNPSYSGLTPQFWGSCDAVCSAPAWGVTSLIDCGKGEPGQFVRVSHGSAPARFQDVEVGVA